jgi:phosphoinositide-3-kinase regulatory subunit 4
MWIHSQEEESVKAQEKELERIREALKGQSHVAPFWLWKVGNLRPQQQVCPVAIVRNNVYTTLSDRLESRPFLTNVEKLWIIYQLLNALQQMHDAGVLHGFLTTENIGLTSWNYLVILDIASYKARTSLPDDDPSEYLYYFQEFHKHGADTTQREKRCYLAPERFFSPKEGASNVSSLTKSMDVFSAGCILLETSLNGERALDLGDLMDYRKKKSFPPSLQQKFQKIESSSLRAACRHMLHLDASQRLSPKEYLERLKDIMPRTFEEALDPFVDRITNQVKTPDARIALAAAKYGDILASTVGVKDADGETHFANILGPCMCKLEGLDCESAAGKKDHLPQSKVLDIDKLLEETDALLKKLETLDLEKAMTLAGTAPGEENPGAKSDYGPTSLPGSSPESFLVFAQVVLATLRHVYRPSSKLVALELLHRLAIHSSDETRLQRIVPSTISLLHDQEPLVRASALNIMTSTLSIVRSFPPSDSKIFPQYIFKRVTHLIGDPSLVVRVAFSSCIASLAETSRRFLDISHAVRLYEAVGAGGSSVDSYKAKGKGDPGVFDEDVAKLLECPDKSDEANMDNSVQSSKRSGVHNTLIANTYDAELSALQDGVSRWVVHITTDPSDQSSGPKRALLRNLARLCNFFGRDGVMTFILPQILAFLNDRRDWQLRASLFDDLPSVCYIVGRAATQHFVLPCLETALVDSEDQVLRSALTCLASLVVQGLLSRAVLLDTRDSGMSERAKK